MKTAEEILRDKWESNGNNSYFDDMYVGERIAIEEAMKDFAKEVAKQTLINVSKSAKTYKNGNTGSWFDASIDKMSILTTSNIPEL